MFNKCFYIKTIKKLIKFVNLPRSLAKGARNIADLVSNLLHLEGHDQVSWKVNALIGMVADGSSSGEGEDIRD